MKQPFTAILSRTFGPNCLGIQELSQILYPRSNRFRQPPGIATFLWEPLQDGAKQSPITVRNCHSRNHRRSLMPKPAEPKVISGNANLPLAIRISEYMSGQGGREISLVSAKVERFNDEEVYVEVYENVRDEDMFIVQPTSKPANDHLMEILIIADALRRSSAARVTAVIPYFGYARQDRRTKARTPISAKLVANLLTQAGISRVLTMDLHSAQVQGFFDVPVDNLYADLCSRYQQPVRQQHGRHCHGFS